MEIAYVSGPHRANTINEVVQKIRRAENVAIKYWKKGYFAYCPHKNTALFDGILPDKVWLKGNLAMLERCDLIVMVQGWQTQKAHMLSMIMPYLKEWKSYTNEALF